MVNVLINGSKGRMGQTLLACASQWPAIHVAGQVDIGDDIAPLIPAVDVVIDFSFHNATLAVAQLCADAGKSIVIGTTGHSAEEKQKILEFTSKISMVWASNYSTGVNALFWLTQKAAEIAGPSFDLEVVEMHHRFKKDAPSGTAATLAQILAEVRSVQLESAARYGRSGIVGERTSTEIGIHSLRGGDVVGDHTVVLAAAGERLELTHRASSRETFANGALRAAAWVVQQPPGLYDMLNVLGLK